MREDIEITVANNNIVIGQAIKQQRSPSSVSKICTLNHSLENQSCIVMRSAEVSTSNSSECTRINIGTPMISRRSCNKATQSYDELYTTTKVITSTLFGDVRISSHRETCSLRAIKRFSKRLIRARRNATGHRVHENFEQEKSL